MERRQESEAFVSDTPYGRAYAAGHNINTATAIAALSTAIETLVNDGVDPNDITTAANYLFPSTVPAMPLLLAVHPVPGRENDIYDALNETLRELVLEGAVNDTNDKGWAFNA